MALDIAIRTYDYSGNEDRTWLATRKGFDTCRSVTLDVSLFHADNLSAKGAIASGCALGLIGTTANGGVVGKYGPYDTAATDGRQTCTGLLFNTTVIGGNGPDGLGSAAVVATAADVSVPMLWEGVIVAANLPIPANANTKGLLESTGKADLTHCVFE